MSFVEDLAPYFADFGTVATVSGVGDVTGIFDTPFAGSFGDLVGDTSPTFTAATADVSAVVVGTSLTINATGYTVARIEPDGTGITRLVLK